MYARRHPATYVVGRENQDLSRRIIFRWTALAIVHGCVLYFFAAKIYSNGMSGYAVSYFANGSGGGLATFGTSLYTIMIISLTITALLNTKTWVVGVYSCKTGVGRLWDRIPYTLIGVFVTTIGLVALAFGVYQQTFFANWSQVQGFFFLVPPHVFVYRPVWYLQLVVVCAVANLADVMFKCFGFFYYPSQTLVHQEISELERRALVKSVSLARATGCARRRRGSMMTYKMSISMTIMRVAGSATSAMRKPQIGKRVRNDEA
jgi:hypothetical protein